MSGKIQSCARLRPLLLRLRRQKKKIVFTNGCFDLLHLGHVRLLEKAKSLGDVLVVGLNTDASVRRLKGKTRPLTPQRDRASILAALEAVDFVTFFSEPTPARLIRQLDPDVLVKGGDYAPEAIVGADWVRRRGGKVAVVPLVEGRGTTRTLQRMAAAAARENGHARRR